MMLSGVGFRGPAPAPHLPAAGHRHRGLGRFLHLGGAHHQERSQFPTIFIVLCGNLLLHSTFLPSKRSQIIMTYELFVTY